MQDKNLHKFDLLGETLSALGSGALWWDKSRLLCVSDLHLGKSNRIARHGGPLLPPYETRETLAKLEQDISVTQPDIVICLGDSFDDLAASESLGNDENLWITRLQAGRRWIWIEGNHDPGPVGLGGEHIKDFPCGALNFTHIPNNNAVGEVAGHFHPKMQIRARGRTITRPSFVHDGQRLVMPAYGAFTGGMRCTDAAVRGHFGPRAFAILTGEQPLAVPLP